MNHPCLQFTRFVDLGEDGREIEDSYGYRLYDDFDHVYDNNFSSFAELSDVINRNNVVDFIWSNHFEFADAITSGFYFNDEWIDSEELGDKKGPERNDPTSH